jgi:phosphoribosylglycinamide formyltransferase-1
MKLALFVSGTGSNARAIIDRFQAHPEDGVEVVLLVSNKANAGALLMAAERSTPTLVLKRDSFNNSEALLDDLRHFNVDFIALAGFLWLIPAYLVKAFPNRMLNIHPALLPDYGGKGMYGARGTPSSRRPSGWTRKTRPKKLPAGYCGWSMVIIGG